MKYVMAILTALAVLVMSRWLMGNRDEAEHEQLLPDGSKPDLESPRPIAERGTDAAGADESDEGAAARAGVGTDAADVVKSGDAVELGAEATDDATPAGEDAFRDMKEAEADAAAEEDTGDEAAAQEEAGDEAAAQEDTEDEAAAQEDAEDEAEGDEAATDQGVEEAATETGADETDAVADADQADDGAGEGQAADNDAEDAAGDEAGDEHPAATGAEDSEDESPFGEGSAHAAEDGSGPEGWQVKGNSDSMLYHTPDSPYYGRTKAEVWFETEDAADDAGFRRWEDDASDDDHAAANAGDDSATSDETATDEEDGDGAVEGPYGPGSAASAEDGSGPEGWAVKGNADSMLYHTEDSHSFEQTKAEVWFESEEAAQAAGFKRWDHRQ